MTFPQMKRKKKRYIGGPVKDNLNMHLYLRNNRITREIPGITLKDGCIPVVANQLPTQDKDDKPVDIEPAVWFKVLILDSITIDCTKRGIKWISKESQSSRLSAQSAAQSEVVHRRPKRQTSKTLYSEEEYYNYQSNMDGMFQKAMEVMSAYSNMKITTYEFNETLLQLLHCYILPAIRLSTDDIPQAERAYEYVEELIAEKNEEIVAKNTDIQRQKDALAKLRKTFVKELQGDTHQIPLYPAELRECLLADLKMDISLIWGDLETCQRAVEEAKCNNCKHKYSLKNNQQSNVSSTHGSSTFYDYAVMDEQEGLQLTNVIKTRGNSPGVNEECTNCHADLATRRETRDQQHETYLKHISARELLMNFKTEPKRGSTSLSSALRSSFRNLKGERYLPAVHNPLYTMYTEHSKHLSSRKEELLCLTHRKVLITSVKEALRAALADLKSGSDTFGIELARSGSQRDTDVLRQSHVPLQWQTLDEQISRLVNMPSHDIGRSHREFCALITNSCMEILPAAREGTVSPETEDKFNVIDPMFCMAPPKKISYPPSNFDSEEDFIIIEEAKTTEAKIIDSIQILKEDIHNHFENICTLILRATESHAEVNYRKVWMCYESHFYEATMSHLIRLYEGAYSKAAENFTSQLCKLHSTDLDSSEYWIDMLLKNDYDSGNGESAEDIIKLDEETEVKKPVTDFVNDSYESKDRPSSAACTDLTHEFDVLSCKSVDVGLESLKLDIDSHLKCRSELKIKAATMPGRLDHERCKNRSRPPSLKLKSKYLEIFDEAISCITLFVNEPSPLLKLQQLTKCLQSVSSEISMMRENTSVCSDALIDVLVLLLLNFDRDILKALFVQLYFLADLMAPFMDSGPHNYSLVQFHVTIQYLQDRIVMLKLGRSV